jgi:hypothetical protein
MSGGLIIGVIAVGLILAALWALRKGSLTGGSAGPGRSPVYASSGELAGLRKNLRMKTLGNDALIDRLVQAERERMPGLSEVDCYRAAIDRWERDNR